VSVGIRAQLRRIKVQILEIRTGLIRAGTDSNEMSMRLDEAPACGRAGQLLWSPPLLIQKSSDQGATLGLVGIGPKQATRAEARTGSAIKQEGDRYLPLLSRGGALAVILTQDPWTQTRPLAQRAWGAAADEGLRYRARNKIAQNGLARWPGASAYKEPSTCAVNEIPPPTTPDNRRDVKVGRRTARNAERSIVRAPQYHQLRAIACRMRGVWSGHDPRRALWPAYVEPH